MLQNANRAVVVNSAKHGGGAAIASTSEFHPNQSDVAFMETRMRLLKMLGHGKSARSVAARIGTV